MKIIYQRNIKNLNLMTVKQISQSLWLTVLMEIGIRVPVLPSPKPLSYYIQKPVDNRKNTKIKTR